MKYILFETPSGMGSVRVFDDFVDHSAVSREVLGQSPGLKVISAGKIRLTDCGEFSVINGSTTLKMTYDHAQSAEDFETLLRFFRFQI